MPVDQRAALASQLVAVERHVRVETVEATAAVAPQRPVVRAEVGEVLPGPVKLKHRVPLELLGRVHGSDDVLNLFDQPVVEEILRPIADDQFGGVKSGHMSCPDT